MAKNLGELIRNQLDNDTNILFRERYNTMTTNIATQFSVVQFSVYRYYVAVDYDNKTYTEDFIKNKVAFIKFLRKLFHIGLKEAKDLCEHVYKINDLSPGTHEPDSGLINRDHAEFDWLAVTFQIPTEHTQRAMRAIIDEAVNALEFRTPGGASVITQFHISPVKNQFIVYL